MVSVDKCHTRLGSARRHYGITCSMNFCFSGAPMLSRLVRPTKKKEDSNLLPGIPSR